MIATELYVSENTVKIHVETFTPKSEFKTGLN